MSATDPSAAIPEAQDAGKAPSAHKGRKEGDKPDAKATGDGPQWPARETLRLVNHDIPRVDGPVKLSGRARYAHDMRLPGMLHARVLCCPYGVAKVELDLAAAKKTAGVEAVLDLDVGRTSWLGQPVAAVAARTPELAEDGLRALNAKFTPERWSLTREQALAEGAARVGSKGNVGRERTSGDMAEAQKLFEGAAAVVEATYSLPVQHHASLETHGVVVDFRGGDEATIYASTQATFGIAEEAADDLGLAANKITTIVEHMGGGFGSKFGLGLEGSIACKLAKQSGKPVHLLFTRPDEFHAGGNRSGARGTLKGALASDGHLLALVSEVQRLGGVSDGAYAGQPYIYKADKFFTRITSVLTHTDSSRAMRAPGHPQASFMIESLLDELGYKAGIDPLTVRKQSLKQNEVYVRQLDRAAREIGWEAHPHKTAPGKPDGDCVGIGFAISTWGARGGPTCEVDVKLERDGSVSSTVGTQDLGTGTRTYVASIVAEELGLPLAGVTPRIGSNRYGQANGSGGSSTVPMLSPAVKHAAFLARTKLAEHLAPLMKCEAANLRFEGGQIVDATDAKKSMSFAAACKTLPIEGLSVRGTWQEGLAGGPVHGAQAARVQVDTQTGRVQVLAMVCVQDVGLALNPLTLRSQLNGGMVQSLSYALLEERVIDPALGLQLNANFEEYKLAHSMEMPEITAILDEGDTRLAAMGIGEPPIIPGHGAIANAVFNACGARVRDLPITPDKVLAALGRLS